MQTASCAALDSPGGVGGVIYVGSRADLASVTFGSNGEITAMALASGKYLRKYEGKQEKHDIKWTTVIQEPRNVFDITCDLFFWARSAMEWAAIQAMALAKRKFVIYTTADYQVKVAGIDKNPWKPGDLNDERGLNGSLEGGEGATFTAPKEQKVTFKMPMSFDIPKLYKPATTDTATILAELDAMLEA